VNWLITGGCGFIGSAFVGAILEKKDHSVRIVDNLSAIDKGETYNSAEIEKELIERYQLTQGESERLKVFVGDIRDEDLAIKVGRGIDIIVHLAANTGVPVSVRMPRLDCSVNVVGTLNYLESARINHVRKFVFASSSAPLGAVSPPAHEELPAKPMSPYGASKMAGEAYCSAYFHSYGLQTTSLRFSNVYGPGSQQKTSVVSAFFREAINSQTMTIFGDGQQTRDFIFLHDIVSALESSSMKCVDGGEVFHISTGVQTSIEQIAKMIDERLVSHGFVASKLHFLDSRPGDILDSFSINEKARTRLQWTPKISLQEGLRITLEDFIKTVESNSD